MPRVVIIGLDKISDEAFKGNAVVEWGLRSHIKSGDTVVFIHASKDLGSGGKVSAELSADVISDMQRKVVNLAHAKLQNLNATYSLGLENITFSCEVIKGPSAETIAERADKLNADAIIVGSRGLGTVKRALLGSVSQYLATNANTNVIIVKKF
ncbi:adenine nucleotide alpha hydrolases-like protein [Gonapodya prolifera JEL478]|uniref:Adenine nucleotide alpha hydrolases-like protein n=1 Tax=Gonapodya prolifera (strain JEL478) TaxID=1344416 RepID=A0A138ZZ42_GONPJ|nr:adenine nucleotide alpha hydrolases-like protein [Gonapodya prolifera JEL478]|eukprot:KXS09545.1 adenine nucleotide alpha hydrolases-like protein [Gonapodya prolifera JEL478]